MEMKEKFENIAHLRFLQWHNQCTLTFKLNYSDDQITIDEDIQAVRQESETVEGLLQHTKNKILKIFQHKQGQIENKENQNDDLSKQFPDVNIQINLLNKNKPINSETVLKNLERYKNMTFIIFNIKYRVVVNFPVIESIKLPEIIYCGHAVHAAVFKGILSEHEASTYVWSKSKDKKTWEKLGEEYIYMVKNEDVDYYLKFICTPRNSFGEGQPFEAISENVVISMPEIPKCPFEDRQEPTRKFLTGNEFRIVSYNTLSCRYAKNQFVHCPVKYLAIDYRKQLLLKELVGYHADLICLQEVDNKIYSFYFREEFKKLGYGSIYNKKGNRIPEGLAIFFNKNRFSFSGQDQIVFCQEVKTNHHLRSVAKLLQTDKMVYDVFMKQATSMQYCKVKDKVNNELIILANTHLYYHPDANRVRLFQTVVCLDYLKVLYNKEVKNNKSMKVTVIFCGDFNSTPTSDVYKLLTEGQIKYDSGKKAYATTLFHPFQFTSACGTPRFTNYTEDFKACLDYIFYHSSIDCTKHLPFPSEDLLSQNVALPSMVFPSDHVALVADFKYQ